MTQLIESLRSLKTYRFTLRRYKINHSELALSAINPDATRLRYMVGFANVHYIQLPVSWVGSFVTGSDTETEEIINKAGLSISGSSSGFKLYKSLEGEVLILGALMLIKPGDSEN